MWQISTWMCFVQKRFSAPHLLRTFRNCSIIFDFVENHFLTEESPGTNVRKYLSIVLTWRFILVNTLEKRTLSAKSVRKAFFTRVHWFRTNNSLWQRIIQMQSVSKRVWSKKWLDESSSDSYGRIILQMLNVFNIFCQFIDISSTWENACRSKKVHMFKMLCLVEKLS